LGISKATTSNIGGPDLIQKNIGATYNKQISLGENSAVDLYGGYKIQGKDEASEKQLIDDAKAVEAAGAFAVVIEGVKKAAADKITKAVNIPTIGIGASVECDGQVLVIDDMLGLTTKPPKFVKQYTNLQDNIRSAVKAYVTDLRDKKFPSEENYY
jgi:3-methyl-2-oxobutanoate hydroxymethyltransferase